MMKPTLAILALLVASPAMAKCTDPCLGHWLYNRNGKLVLADSRPSEHHTKYTWRGWPAYEAMLCRRYGECS